MKKSLLYILLFIFSFLNLHYVFALTNFHFSSNHSMSSCCDDNECSECCESKINFVKSYNTNKKYFILPDDYSDKNNFTYEKKNYFKNYYYKFCFSKVFLKDKYI